MQTLLITERESKEQVDVEDGEHLILHHEGDPDGPTLVVFGGIHGNEKSGVVALQHVASEINRLQLNIRGRVFFVSGNTRAIKRSVRFVDADLNRHWTAENVKRNNAESLIATNRAEDIEQRELLEIIDMVIAGARNEVYSLDLHSTSSPSTPFAMLGDTLRNRTFAEEFPSTFLLGIEEQLDGTIMEYMNELGAVTLGFEAGQHTTEIAVENQKNLIWLALANSGCVDREDFEYEFFRDRMESAMGRLEIIEIRHRHAISPEDEFRMEPGYATFQHVKKGEVLAHDRHGAIRAVESGMILMPLYQDQGTDGFFIGREVNPVWMWISRVLRNRNVAAAIKYLPGVVRHPENDMAYIVNTRVARIMPLQIFHLLGLRKMRWHEDKLIVSRRRHDTKSPFVKNG
ncbi:MAG: hypothetical protein HKN33_02305 [Pyrinomonadaceae bacterium]|nr:hypothetical protein [Pyrinomonadaceae bacterium]